MEGHPSITFHAVEQRILIMYEDMEKKGIVFDLQWKTRNLVSSGEEFASIGIWEVDDTSLDWSNFKPYLCQTLGNVDNLSVSYVDSDGDLIPIESDCEFQEALKYARKKAAMGQKLILKVEKLDSHSACGGVELSSSPIYIKSSNFIKERLKFHTSNNEDQNPFHQPTTEAAVKIANVSSKVKYKGKTSETTHIQSSEGNPPLWFKKYMQKMKKEIVEEVTSSLTQYFTEVLEGKQKVQCTPPVNPFPEASAACTLDSSIATNVKKVAEENTSEAVKMEIRDRKLLKKIEKLRRREKKLDHKKEKLEQKSKKIAERKEREYLSKLRLERAGCRRPHCDGFIRKYKEAEKQKQKKVVVNESQQAPPEQEPQKPVLGFKLLSNDKRTHSIKRGCKFLKKWKVVNTGNVSWTNETEVKLSWGNAGLEPDGHTWKCPHLKPGEEGEIFIKFHAPDFPGLFESHWNLFHQNTRFGNGLRIIISVDLITSSEDETKSGKESSPSSSDFCVTPKTKTVMVTSDQQVARKEKNESLIISDEAAATPPSEKIFPKIKSFASASVPWESLDDGDDEDEKGAEKIIETRKEGELESVFSDDFNGSFSSIGSDSDDNFVVVPMPPCFRFDVPLNPIPVSTKEESTAPNDNPPETAFSAAQSTGLSSKSPQLSIESLSTASTSRGSPIQEQGEVSCDTGEVISKHVPPSEMPLIADFKQLNMSEPQEVTSPKKKSPEPVLPPPLKPTPAPAPKSRPAPSSAQSNSPPPSDNVPKSPSRSPNGSQQNSGRPSPSINIPNIQARFSPRPRPIDLMPPGISEVWNGAMNVTTSALNTAISALDTIIGPSVTPGHVFSAPLNEAEEEKLMDPQMVADLSHLTSMGFCNLELNEALLRVHNHNIAEVVESLLERED